LEMLCISSRLATSSLDSNCAWGSCSSRLMAVASRPGCLNRHINSVCGRDCTPESCFTQSKASASDPAASCSSLATVAGPAQQAV
jgi:hypothetical protein